MCVCFILFLVENYAIKNYIYSIYKYTVSLINKNISNIFNEELIFF